MNKITEQDLANRGVKGLPDVPGLTTEEMQRKLEEIAREILIPKVNELVEGLNNANSNFSAYENLHTSIILSNSMAVTLDKPITNYREIVVILHSAGDGTSGFEILRIPTFLISYVSNQFVGIHYHYGLSQNVSEYQIGFKDANTFESLYVNNKTDYQLCATIYGYQKA